MFFRIGDSIAPIFLCAPLLTAGFSTAGAQQSGPEEPSAVPRPTPSMGHARDADRSAFANPLAVPQSAPANVEALAALAGLAPPVGGDELVEEPEPEIEAFVTRLEAQLTLRDRLDHGEYTEAVPVAARLVELTAEEFGDQSTEAAVAISNLAESQRRAGLHGDAARNFLASVDLFRQLGGEFSESVITPLIGLGVTYQSMDLHPEAVAALEEARAVSRRVHGLLGEQQVDILSHIANSMVGMEMYDEADAQRLAGLQIMERVHGEKSLEILPELYRHAFWLRDGHRFDRERDQYGRAMTIIRNLEGNHSPLMAQPLRQIGNSFRVQKLPEGRGIGSLKRALEILESQPEPDALQIARVLRDVGDWNVAFSKIGPTGDEYRRAWRLLDEIENGEELQRRWFLEPDYVLREFPSTRGLADQGEPGALPGHVLVTFDVLPSGRTANIRILESVPPGLKDDSSARSIARSRFRPRVIDGEPVLAEDVARDFTFHFTPRESDE